MKKFLRNLLLMVSMLGSSRSKASTKPVLASFYASRFEGKKMANGQPFRAKSLSAASTHYPLGSMLRVTSLKTGKAIDVPVTDRGPWGRKFQLDLSPAAFKALGLRTQTGYGQVTIERLS